MRLASEAIPIALLIFVPFAAGAIFLHPLVALPGALGLAFVLWFFRDPERTPPDEPGCLVSPADGRIIKAGPKRISVFMNVFNVHVCRAPTGGRIESVEHSRGGFLAAYRDHASEQNERVSIVVGAGAHAVRFTLVAGLVARRIVCKVVPGDTVGPGQRIGLIQFGSRVDIDPPGGSRVMVAVGDRVVAGETPIARVDPDSVSR